MPRNPSGDGAAVGTRSHPDQRGAQPVYQPQRLLPRRSLTSAAHRCPSRPPWVEGGREGGAMNADRQRRMVKRVLRVAGTVLAVTLAVVSGASGAAGADGHELRPASGSAGAASARWSWPVSPPRITVAYRAPAHAYGPGHRGIDLASALGADVRAPDDGVVAFAGVVVDRPLITIDHGDGLVSTMEPVSAIVPVGTSVQRGEQVGTVATRGHTAPGEIHLGARRDDVYLNPLRLLGEVPRAVLLPCCEPAQQPG